ncbi:hypothetical protein H257_16452 [Aphanomyces astaci]|uniref:Uncharacterized protein n=1 Tax=Aphanomyces astaci TaxID=112090 RepID=W4FKX0_APHAT|nr:hypothetical protein H257_16452 [Aphanomyces astaci]ETV67368.1 hypothetical protein H257_16452 [Aphanomyces astaci]|eukprot:XP_009843183.1 hypothetical protein H257_16452 [Aphanomyces astaci]
MVTCIFYDCHNPVVQHGRSKCIVHHSRTPCSTPKCRNQAYARGRCVRHGARKYCLMEGCMHYRRTGGYCARHTKALRANFSLASGPRMVVVPPRPQKNGVVREQWTTSPRTPVLSLDAEWTVLEEFLNEVNFALLTTDEQR